MKGKYENKNILLDNVKKNNKTPISQIVKNFYKKQKEAGYSSIVL